MKIGDQNASPCYERAAMELTSLVSGMTEFAANLYPLKTEGELVALLSGMHHFPPGVPERARRVHERLPAGSALCSSDFGVLIDRLDTEGGGGRTLWRKMCFERARKTKAYQADLSACCTCDKGATRAGRDLNKTTLSHSRQARHTGAKSELARARKRKKIATRPKRKGPPAS